MDENTGSTIFNQGQPQAPSNFNTKNSFSQPPANSSVENGDESPSFFFKIIKILIGVLVFGLFIFLIFKFIFPLVNRSSQSQTVTLNYWGLWEDKRTMDSVIQDFEKLNPNIKINYSKQDIKQYRERLLTRIENGDGPDIFRFHNSWLLQISNVLLPLPSETINKEEFQKWFYPVTQKDLVRNGAIYGVPLEIDTLSLFTNTEMLKLAGLTSPKTWDDFVKTSKTLTVKDESGKIKTSGAAMGTFDNINHASDIISLLLVQNGANLENLSQTPENASDALVFYTSFAKDQGNVWDSTLDPSILAFAKGNLGMYFGYSWDVFNIKAINQNLAFEINTVPKLPGRNSTIASYWVEGVSAKSKHSEEAFLFLKYLIKKETQQKLFTEISKTRFFGEPYSRVDLSDSLKDNTLVYPFVQDAQNATSSFFVSDTNDNGLNSQANNYLGNAVRSILGNTSPESAIKTLTDGVDQVLNQYKTN